MASHKRVIEGKREATKFTWYTRSELYDLPCHRKTVGKAGKKTKKIVYTKLSKESGLG